MAVTKIHGQYQIMDLTIKDGQIATDAAIATSKLADGAKFIQNDGSVAWDASGSPLNMNGVKITGLANGTAASDAVNKSQLDAVSTGLDVKESCRVATTADLAATYSATGKTLTANANGAISVDGVSLNVDDRVLVKDQSTKTENGIYVVTTVGDASNPFVLTRAADFDEDDEVTAGAFTFVEEGTTNADSGWVLVTDNPITIDTTDLEFTQFSGAGQIEAGDGLTKTGNRLDVQVDGTTIEIVSDTLKVVDDLSIDSLEDLSTNHVILGSASGNIQAEVITREVPSGTIDGTNAAFTLAQTPVTGTEEVFLNGLLQNAGASNDYTISGDTITFNSAPASGSVILVNYLAS